MKSEHYFYKVHEFIFFSTVHDTHKGQKLSSGSLRRRLIVIVVSFERVSDEKQFVLPQHLDDVQVLGWEHLNRHVVGVCRNQGLDNLSMIRINFDELRFSLMVLPRVFNTVIKPKKKNVTFVVISKIENSHKLASVIKFATFRL